MRLVDCEMGGYGAVEALADEDFHAVVAGDIGGCGGGDGGGAGGGWYVSVFS